MPRPAGKTTRSGLEGLGQLDLAINWGRYGEWTNSTLTPAG